MTPEQAQQLIDALPVGVALLAVIGFLLAVIAGLLFGKVAF